MNLFKRLMHDYFKLNGVIIYLLCLVILIKFSYVSFWVYIFSYLFVNPLMIYCYDYLINPNRLSKKIDYYYIIGFLCLFIDLAIWNFIRFPKISLFPPNFIPIIIVLFFIAQIFICIYSRKRDLSRLKIFMILFIFPLISYGFLGFILSFVLKMAS